MEANMTFDQHRHQAIESPSASCDQLKHIGGLGVRVQRFLNGIHLAANPPHPVNQLFPILDLTKVEV